MSGTSNSTKSIGQTFDQSIDGLLSGVGWNDATIFYAFPTSGSAYGYSGETSTFGLLSDLQQAAAHRALNASGYDGANGAQKGFSVEGFTNLNVVYGQPSTAHVRFGESDSPSTAWAYYPSTWVKGGDVWYGRTYDYRSPEAGNYAWHTTIHEIGHALGLKHGQETGGYGAVPYDEDSMEFSVMTYRSYIGDAGGGYNNERWGFAQSWMMLDIAALQHMYGADFSTNSGDTTYRWNPNSGDTLVDGGVGIDAGANRIFATVWDGGGVDTYDLRSYTTDLSIDLAPGGHSTFSQSQIAYLGSGHEARGNIFNAMQYQGDSRSLIENAKGGSGHDLIAGNTAKNKLGGGKGNDDLRGYGNADTLSGGRGNDKLKGGSGNDKLKGGYGNDRLDGGGGTDSYFFKEAPGRGVDTIVTFQSGEKIKLDNADFSGIGGEGTLAGKFFVKGSGARDGNDRVIYKQKDGKIYYDEDGKGGDGKVLFAKLDPGTGLDNQDFIVI